MDRALGDIINEGRQRDSHNNRRDRRPGPRDGVRKNQRDEPRNLDRDWVHDRFEDDYDHDGPRQPRGYRAPPRPRRSPESELTDQGVKLRVDNLHYDLTEEDIRELFAGQGPLVTSYLLYDRSDRSRGVAFVVYRDERDAERAIRDFDGANAYGQPIRVSRARESKARNPFDYVERPGRSLFDRVETRRRSASPDARGPGRNSVRHSDVSRPAPDGIDRYVPGEDRRRSPMRRGRGGASRGPGQRRENDRGAGRERDGRPTVQGRPRKTQEELDAEMEDYWGKGNNSEAQPAAGVKGNGTTAAPANEDMDMIE